MNTKIKVGKDYQVEINLVDPLTSEPYTHECPAEVVDWFANGPHFYFDDAYGLEAFVKVNSERVLALKSKKTEFIDSAFKAGKWT